MDCSPPGSSDHGTLQARILEQVTISFSMGSPWPRDRTRVSCVSCTVGRLFTTDPTGKPVDIWAYLNICLRVPRSNVNYLWITSESLFMYLKSFLASHSYLKAVLSRVAIPVTRQKGERWTDVQRLPGCVFWVWFGAEERTIFVVKSDNSIAMEGVLFLTLILLLKPAVFLT